MADSSRKSAAIFWASLLIAGMALLAVTGRSFWIDECTTAEFAKIPPLADCWHAMERYPEVQLPLYMLYVRGWVQFFGSGEWVLRMAGLPWFVAGAVIFVAGLRRLLGTVLVPTLLISSSAFAWYYLNEARVYSLQLGLALALAGSGAVIVQSVLAGSPGRGWWRCFLASLFLLCGTSPLGAVWGVFLFAAVLFLIPRRRWRELWRLAPVAGGICVAGLAALAAYYAWTLTLPARPTAGTTNAQTVLFVFYELLGLSGWGPGRNVLRSAGVGALKPFLICLASFGMLAGVVGWNGFKELSSRFTRRRVLQVMALVCTPLLLIGALGVATHFRVLGRHATPLLPLLLMGLAFGLVRLMRLRLGRWVAGLFLLGCLGSSLLIRFAPRHEKDDYRGTADRAKSAAESGQQVWWNAEKFGASYYRIADHPRIALVINATKESLQAQPEPDLIVASRPESYDNTGAVADYVQKRDYRLVETRPPFTFWIRRVP
jgi:hypothetical protein